MVRIALFGTGAAAERAATVIDGMAGLSLTAVADNSPAKQGTTWRGRRVSSARELADESDGWDYVCVASVAHTVIARQLIDLGISPVRLAIADPWAEGGLLAGLPRLSALLDQNEPPPPSPQPAVGFEEDFAQLQHLRKLGFAPTHVLDIGASDGCWTFTASQIFPEAEYVLVEPVPHYNTILRTDLKARTRRLQMALGPRDGDVDIIVPVHATYGIYDSSVLQHRNGRQPQADTVRVPMRRVDTLLAEGVIAPPELVKIDVQGYEADVLAGAARLWQCTEVFFVELSLDPFWTGSLALPEMIGLFAAHGFIPMDFFHEFRSPNGTLAQIDAVFVKRGGPLASRRFSAGA